MEVKLIVVSGKHPGQEVTVSKPEFLIGRADDCHLRPQSNLVSRRHCVILIEEGAVKVRDLKSSNGTFVNGERIQQDRELKMGDRLKVGPLEFEVRLSVSVGGKKKPKVHSIQEAAARTVETKDAPRDDDLDLSDWLSEEDNQTTVAATSPHTTTIRSTPTVATGPVEPAKTAQQEPQPEPGKEGKQGKTKVVGRFQSGKAPNAVSSGEAASEVLRQLFNPGRKR